MNESIGDRSGLAMASEKAVTFRKRAHRVLERVAKILGRVGVVVQVNLDLAKSAPAKTGQPIEMLGLVNFDRIEERVTRRPAVGIAELALPPRGKR